MRNCVESSDSHLHPSRLSPKQLDAFQFLTIKHDDRALWCVGNATRKARVSEGRGDLTASWFSCAFFTTQLETKKNVHLKSVGFFRKFLEMWDSGIFVANHLLTDRFGMASKQLPASLLGKQRCYVTLATHVSKSLSFQPWAILRRLSIMTSTS